jgi:MFS family permease
LTDQFGLPLMFTGYVVLMVIGAVAVSGAHIPKDVSRQSESHSFREAWAAMFANPSMPALLVALALIWFLMPILTFEPIFLDQLGASETIIGLTFTLPALVEAGIMLWVDRQARTTSPVRLLQLGILAGMARAVLVLVSPTVPVIVAARVLEGPGYALRQVAIVLILSRLAPPGQRAMLMALSMSTLLSVVQIVGQPIAGLLFDTIGVYWLYAIAVCLQLITILILQAILPRLAADIAPSTT